MWKEAIISWVNMWSFKKHYFVFSSDAVTDSWKLCSLCQFSPGFCSQDYGAFLLQLIIHSVCRTCCIDFEVLCFLELSHFFSLLGFPITGGGKNKRKLHWGNTFRLLQYNDVAMAVFLQLCCYFCVLQNPCLGYKLQQKEQTLPPVSIYKLFQLLLARPSGKLLIP